MSSEPPPDFFGVLATMIGVRQFQITCRPVCRRWEELFFMFVTIDRPLRLGLHLYLLCKSIAAYRRSLTFIGDESTLQWLLVTACFHNDAMLVELMFQDARIHSCDSLQFATVAAFSREENREVQNILSKHGLRCPQTR